ncbi:uncharacterized protein [Nicotiana tomentosiformis]|uniref:uncharacterized protein n=1 Tax=Nicotiana tomentosiformis TaxID=4098 RepID=UPI00388C7559
MYCARAQDLRGGAKEVTIGNNGILRLQGRICVPNMDGLKELILDEDHSSRYSIHPGATNMHCYLKQHYWWWRMKKDVVGHISRCMNCQWVKYEHPRLGGLLQCLEIREWKLECITIDFVVGLPETLRRFDVVWQKSYAGRKVCDVAFLEGEKVLLRALPMKGMMRFGKKVKLSPRYIGPFEVLQRVCEVAYRLDLPSTLSGVHLVLYVSMLRKYHED